MSRTNHRKEKSEDTRRSSRPQLSRKRRLDYRPSRWDRPSNRGEPGSWIIWLMSLGYYQARKIRGERKRMKVYGRRVERRARKAIDVDNTDE